MTLIIEQDTIFMSRLRWFFIFCCITFFITACGQTGKLYLPEQNMQNSASKELH